MIKIPGELVNHIKNSQNFLLLAHQKPDGDALGSVAALGAGLKSAGKEVDYFIDPVREEVLSFIQESPYFSSDASSLKEKYDMILYLDTSSKDYAFEPKKLPECNYTAVIDHHKSNLGFCDFNCVRVTGATGELVYSLLQELDIPLSDAMKDDIFTAITTDTGSFQYGNTVSNTHEVAAALHENGKSFAPLSKKLHSEKTFGQLKLLGAAIHSIQLHDQDRIAIFNISKEDFDKWGGSENVTSDVTNIGIDIPSVEISAFIKETGKDQFKVSVRAKSTSRADASKVALQYGGGGHKGAAGFSINGNKEEVVSNVLHLLEDEISESEENR